MRLAASIAALVLAPLPALAQSNPGEVHFAKARIGVWETDAVTFSDGGDIPLVREIHCVVRTNGVALWMRRTGEVIVDIRGISEVDASGSGQDFTALNVSAITIGGETWEAKPVAVNALSYRFTDVPYPPAPGDGLVLTYFQGYSAVRRPGGPWFKADILADRLSRAASVDISYGVRSEDRKTESIRHFYAPLTGLSEAMLWCQTQMTSEAALRIHAEP